MKISTYASLRPDWNSVAIKIFDKNYLLKCKRQFLIGLIVSKKLKISKFSLTRREIVSIKTFFILSDWL